MQLIEDSLEGDQEHLEDDDNGTIVTVLDQLHEAFRDLFHREDAVVLLQHVPVVLTMIVIMIIQ